MISIDGYTDIERIGRGGLGDVYRAVRTSTGGTVAIKVLRDVSDESVAWHRTRRELTALVSLAGHANVIQLLEVLDLPEGPVLVMEYAPGGSVADLMLRRDRPLSVGETVLVGRQTATALVAAHERGIVHRDVKPQNLLIDAYGQVKLCDFGIAAMARSEEFQSRTSAISMRYASPEDLDDDIDVGPPSDVYSLGATMLHLARGAPPTLKERLAPWMPPATDDEELAALDAIVASCLQPQPGARPSASEVADELERLGWSIDERNRAIAFESVDLDVDLDDAPTDPRTGRPSSPDESVGRDDGGSGTDDAPTVPRASASPEPFDRDRDPGAHDDTVYRPDRLPARPAPTPTRRRRPFVIGALLVVAAVALVVLWPNGDGVGVTFVERPAGLTDVRALDWPFGDVGECLVQRDERLDPVGCDAPHDLQRIAVGTLDAAADAAFDQAAVRAEVGAACEAAFLTFVGASPADSDLDAPFTAPSAASWTQDGDRRFQCLVGAADRRIVGDAEGAGR
ncbi:MAG: serine/threonine-protein kinase [Ilumatobacteraceae bacterium]|nr:serine/threonine-protein kinase [Ilumatobacteraceae bacterium]